ncbi:hypothetical protein O3P69_004649 [Scylla paramamosain]|uniref:Mutator-like transposase domain-containing protein n=1 Tax=Scylla paramamosain TaxID=85552 RepID=A0AAW0UBE5_SCYPA
MKPVKPTTPDKTSHSFITVTLSQLQSLVENQKCPLRSCKSKLTVTRCNGLKLNQALVTGGKINKAAFMTYCKFLYHDMNAFYEQKVKEGGAGVVKYYADELLRLPNENGILDVDVSFDSSCMRRGHASHAGIGFAMEENTGIVVDLDVLSNFCISCSNKRTQKKHKCYKNFDGKAGDHGSCDGCSHLVSL